jgi:hypothetical protein
MVKMQRIFAFVMAALLLVVGCQTAISPSAEAPGRSAVETVDLSEIKRYLQANVQALEEAASALAAASDRYYALASEANFDYAALWQRRSAEAVEALMAARTAWMTASPLYEKVEGIVAGTPALATFDVILDAGASGEEDPENAAPIDLTLPDGRILPRPGNLFGVTESTLWGTDPDYVLADVTADWDGDGALGFGEVAPDANVLKGGADALYQYVVELSQAVEAWEPTTAEAFTALIVMTPTMSEYFASWRDSRFVAREASTQRDFVAISRLADIQDILGGLEVVYAQVRPLAETANPEQAAQIAAGLSALKSFVADIYAQEQAGRRYTPEEADILGAEAQNRATAITGQISQIAAELGIELVE